MSPPSSDSPLCAFPGPPKSALASPSFPPFRHDQPIPWLLCSVQKSDTSPNHSDLTFYDLSTAAYYSVRIPIPSLCDHQWLGSYKGWLVTLDKQLQLHLIKPLTGAHVLLPSKGIENEHPKKVILCHRYDNPNELQAFCLIKQGCLVSVKVGDDNWTRMTFKHFVYSNTTYQDIAIYQGKLYAVSRNVLSCWNLRSSYNEHLFAYSSHYFWKRYLLEWNNELIVLMIDREEGVSLENHEPKQVKLYKLKLTYYVCSFSYVRSLKNDALFFGDNGSYAVSSSCHDDIQRNFIYFTDQVQRCFHDHAETSHSNQNFEAFDYGKHTYKPCCPQGSPMHLTSPPIWFWPC